jgi:hypothetical protein
MKQKIIFFFIFLLLLSIVFRSLIFNFSSSLIDWRDYALMVWIMFQNVTNILSLNFYNYFETNAFYPHRYSLLFSDLLLPQSIIFLPFYLLTKNLILSFNLVFILTFILNYISTFLFWKQIFKKSVLAFFGSILFIFSPFFHIEYSHFQMMSYWPFFFSFYFLYRAQVDNKYLFWILSGVFLSIQFTASVYLSVYLITVILIYALFSFTGFKNLKKIFIGFGFIFLAFLLLSGVFIKGYFDMRNEHNIKRDLGEYITYSAHLSDYIFSSSINSIVHKSALLNKWNSFDKNGWGGHASFGGFLLFAAGLIGLFMIVRERKAMSIVLQLDRQKGFFISVMLVGLLFSLGPRINFNGTYAHIPTPYSLILKYVPLFEATRVPARWSFLFFLGFTFFALLGLDKISQSKSRNFILLGFFVIFVLEYLPFNIKASVGSYSDDRDLILKQLCENEKQVVLELPATHLNAENNIADGLSYITAVQLASTVHGCYLINGYSGYDMPSIFELSERMDQSIDQNNTEQFIYELKQRNINIVKFNPDNFPPTRQGNLQKFFDTLENEKELKRIDPTIYQIQ